jgi:peptide chain release factor 2
MTDMAITEEAGELESELRRELDKVAKKLAELETLAMLGGPYDDHSAIISLQAGAGGIDSQDWAQMLFGMFSRWAESHGFTTRILDWMDGEEAGIKRADLEVAGPYAYGYLKGEAGVHRLIRLSPFDNQHLRHTSFALVEVLPEVENEVEVTINPEELRIDYFRSSGAGGQNVQKNATAVRLVHEPSGITVSVQNERSQARNREIAMKILMARLMERELARRREEEAKLRGEFISPEWGNQIRTYVLHPYKMVKDHRTNYEVSDPEAVLSGEALDGFLMAYLRSTVGTQAASR